MSTPVNPGTDFSSRKPVLTIRTYTLKLNKLCGATFGPYKSQTRLKIFYGEQPENHYQQNKICSDEPSQIALCDRCKLELETALHATWSCRELDVVWEDDGVWGFRRSSSFLSFKELLSWLIMNTQEIELFAVTAWSIWNQRNRVCMHQPSCSTHLLAATAKESLAEFLLVQPAAPLPIPKPRVQWQPLPQVLVKINFDGATSKDHMPGIGVVLRDDRGSVLASLSQNIPQVCRPLDIETLAASRALKFAADLGFNKVVLKGDCEVLMKALKGGDQFLSTVGLVMDDIQYDANLFYQLRYSHVRREGNKVAHSLARHALEITDFVIQDDIVSFR